MRDQKIIDALYALADRNGGRLTPDIVVAAARSNDSPLHAYFASRDCWDTKKAADHWAVAVARDLIRSVKVEVTTTDFTVKAPAFVRDPSAGDAQGYASLSRLRSDTDLAREAVVAEFARVSAALARAQAVAAALNLTDEIGELRSRMSAFADRVESAGVASH
jgi:hypothetical protein